MGKRVDYLPISELLPIEDSTDVHKWHKFISPENNGIFYSLLAKAFVSGELEVIVHRSFINALKEVVSRKGVRGQDYVIFSTWENGSWYIQARIDRHFISEEDVINE